MSATLTAYQQEFILDFLRTEWLNHDGNIEYHSGKQDRLEERRKTIAWNKARIADIMLIQDIIQNLPVAKATPKSGKCPF